MTPDSGLTGLAGLTGGVTGGVTGLQLALAAGALVGLAVALLLWRLAPTEPDLADALRRLSPQPAAQRRFIADVLRTSPGTGSGTGPGTGSGIGPSAGPSEGPPAGATAEPGPVSPDLEVWWLSAPTDRSVDLSDPALDAPLDTRVRLGVWGMKSLPVGMWGSVPTRELAILRISVARYYGEKLIFAFLGLLIPPLLTTFFLLLGAHPPFFVPVGATLALAVAMFFLPDYNVRDDAKKARTEFARALGAYIDFVALERNSGAGPRQAMEVAATIGDSWVFRRLGEELARTRWSGLTPWEALHGLADELGLPELDDLADIMRLSGEEGAQIYSSLRARSAGMRTAMLSAEKTKANEIGERMSIPMSLLGVIFMAILVAPAILRVIGGT